MLKNYANTRDTGSEEHYPNIFAVGDCALTEQGEWKMAYVGGERAKHVAANIIALDYSDASKMTDAAMHPSVMILPVGSEKGVAALPMGFSAGDFMVRNVKGRLLMTDMFWSKVGTPASPVKGAKSGNFETLEIPAFAKRRESFVLKKRMSDTNSPKVKAKAEVE